MISIIQYTVIFVKKYWYILYLLSKLNNSTFDISNIFLKILFFKFCSRKITETLHEQEIKILWMIDIDLKRIYGCNFVNCHFR